MKLDVTNDDEVRQVVESIQRDFGHLDIVVNNAARMGQGGGDFWGSSPENLDAYYRTNVRAPYLITTLVGPHMEQIGGGAIINITSGGPTCHGRRGRTGSSRRAGRTWATASPRRR